MACKSSLHLYCPELTRCHSRRGDPAAFERALSNVIGSVAVGGNVLLKFAKHLKRFSEMITMEEIESVTRDKSRREFLKQAGMVPAMMIASRLAGAQQTGAVGRVASSQSASPGPDHGKTKPFIAIQIGARSFVDEGVDRCLDTLQDKASVNVLMPTVFTYGRGLAGRQIPGQPFPDHGVQEYDEIHGGSYTKVHPEYYANSVIQNIRAPELGDFDILADVTPKAKARGMKVYCLFEEAYNPRLMPNFEKIAEVDLYGRIGRSTCFNNPDARTFLTSMVQDWFANNELDGMMWESERQGPLNTALRADFGTGAHRSICCFCTHCTQKATAMGINVERARAGFMALDRWVNKPDTKAGNDAKSAIALWRIMLEYPELLAWHSFWFHSQEEIYGLLYGTVKEINPQAQVGWHIMHLVTMSPLYQADQDYARLARYSDFIKPSPYNNCAGPRFARYIRNVRKTMYSDFTPEEVLDLHYRLLHLQGEPTLAQLPTAGLSANYVGRETARAIESVNGSIPIYPGIDIDIPTALTEKRTQPSDVKAAVLAAFRAGAPGVVLSRKYAEMRLANLAGAGAALRELAVST